jgi:hypothetical protein
MIHKLKLLLFSVFVVIGVLRAWGVEGSPAQQSAEATYKNNKCVNCHSQLVGPLHVGNRYLEVRSLGRVFTDETGRAVRMMGVIIPDGSKPESASALGGREDIPQ